MTLYSSGFKDPPFAPNPGYWAGVDGWLATDPSNGSIGVTSDGGAVFMGGTPPAGSVAAAIKNFGYDPVASGTPIVKIRASLAINDSTNAHYDTFAFAIYNSSGSLLSALFFDNANLTAYYNDGRGEQALPGRFVNNGFFQITLTADFSTNRVSATARYPGASELPLFTNRAFHGAGGALNLSSFEVLWILNSSGTAGDNYLVLDSLSIEAFPAPVLAIDKGGRYRAKRSFCILRGSQAAGDDVSVQVRPPGRRAWVRAKGPPQRWWFTIKNLKIGRNVAGVRLLNAVGGVIDQKKVTIVRK